MTEASLVLICDSDIEYEVLASRYGMNVPNDGFPENSMSF